jgi:hypothetical protein
MRDGAGRRHAAIAAAEAELRAARAPYLAAADEVLDVRGHEGMRDLELAAWRRMIALHGPVGGKSTLREQPTLRGGSLHVPAKMTCSPGSERRGARARARVSV